MALERNYRDDSEMKKPKIPGGPNPVQTLPTDVEKLIAPAEETSKWLHEPVPWTSFALYALDIRYEHENQETKSSDERIAAARRLGAYEVHAKQMVARLSKERDRAEGGAADTPEFINLTSELAGWRAIARFEEARRVLAQLFVASSIQFRHIESIEQSEIGLGVAEWGDEIKGLLADLPADYAARYQKLHEHSHLFRAEVARQLEPALNTRLQQMPQDSLDDKQTIASWVNGQLRGLGLAIKCPRTGRPANLIGEKKEKGSDVSRFRLEIRNEQGKKTRTVTWSQLPKLDLMEDEPRQEPIVEWSARVRGRRGGREIE